MLILVLNGFLAGMNRQVTSYLDHSPGSIVVAQEDVVDLLGIISLLPEGMLQKAETIRGVDEAVPILSQFVILNLPGKEQPAYMIEYDARQDGGPWELTAGREPRSKPGIVCDRMLADRNDSKLSDEVEVMKKDFTIVGLSRGTTSWVSS